LGGRAMRYGRGVWPMTVSKQAPVRWEGEVDGQHPLHLGFGVPSPLATADSLLWHSVFGGPIVIDMQPMPGIGRLGQMGVIRCLRRGIWQTPDSRVLVCNRQCFDKPAQGFASVVRCPLLLAHDDAGCLRSSPNARHVFACVLPWGHPDAGGIQ